MQIDKTDLNNTKAAEIFKEYSEKVPNVQNDTIDELQRNYDRCVYILENISLREVNLLWQMRQLPEAMSNSVENLVDTHFAWWKNYDCFHMLYNTVRSDKSEDNNN